MATRKLSYREAINEALSQEMERDPSVIVMGEDNAGGAGAPGEDDAWGGVLGVTKGLYDKFPGRVLDTPDHRIRRSSAPRSAPPPAGMRPVAELMFIDFAGVCLDQIMNQAAKFRYMFGGKAVTPVVIRTMYGAGLRAAAQHSQGLYPVFTHLPGLKVVLPSSPYEAKGLLIQSIRDDDPVIFCEHKAMYDVTGDVPEESYTIPFGEANVVREGDDVTIVAIGPHGDVRRAGRRRTRILRCLSRSHRSTHRQPARPGHHPGIGGEDRPARRRGRGQPAVQPGHRYLRAGGVRGVRRPEGADQDGQPAARAGAVRPAAGGFVHPVGAGHRQRGQDRDRMEPVNVVADERIQRITMPKWGLSMERARSPTGSSRSVTRSTEGTEICEIDTDKIAGELESTWTGVVRALVVDVNESVPVGGTIAVVAPAEVPQEEIDAVVAEAREQLESGVIEDDSGPKVLHGRRRRAAARLRRAGRTGGNDPVVFVHGYGGDKNSWLFVQEPIAADRATYARRPAGARGVVEGCRRRDRPVAGAPS